MIRETTVWSTSLDPDWRGTAGVFNLVQEESVSHRLSVQPGGSHTCFHLSNQFVCSNPLSSVASIKCGWNKNLQTNQLLVDKAEDYSQSRVVES